MALADLAYVTFLASCFIVAGLVIRGIIDIFVWLKFRKKD